MRYCLYLASLFFIFTQATRSQEFLLHEETFVWTKDADACGGFHYWYNIGNAPSTNWKVPHDYQYGTYYFRFEVLEQPSNDPFKLNMCIWTEFNGSTWKEECMGLSPDMAGAGSLVTFSSPVTFQLNGVNIDWTDLTKLWRIGNPIFVNGHNLGPNSWCTSHPEEWANVDRYLPLKLRITIVAVASGYTFSGWSNYIGGCTPGKQATPSYSIDYANATTNKVVLSTDEYSYSSNMSGAVSGNGQKLALTPGTTVYFRTKKVNDCILASDIQTLVVPSRPAAPTISVDYINERTSETIASSLEYDQTSLFTSPVSGPGNKLSLVPGQDLYFRSKPTSGSFSSLVYHLNVPDRPPTPQISFDFITEKTGPVPANMEWSTSITMTSPTSGTTESLTVTPGNNLYFRIKPTASSFSSAIQSLTVPERPTSPTFSVDFANERTIENISPDIEWSSNPALTSAVLGNNAAVNVTPGIDLYFRKKSTSGSFSSAIFALNVPERPASPLVSINFLTEKTIESINEETEWSDDPSFSSTFSGTNVPIAILAGNDLYFRKKSSADSFKSSVFNLNIPDRPATPVFSIDYENEETNEIIESLYEYSSNADMSMAADGNNLKVLLKPGTDLFFRKKSTETEFSSLIQELSVPSRPSAPGFGIDFISERTSSPMTSAFLYAEEQNMSEVFTGNGEALPIEPGKNLYIIKKATDNSFASEKQELFVPLRPPAPGFSIDFINETTAEIVSENCEYDTVVNMINGISGLNGVIPLKPGIDYYFRSKSTGSSFSGDVFKMEVPKRPVIHSLAGDTVQNDFTAEVIYEEVVTGFDSASLNAINAKIVMIDAFSFKVMPLTQGIVTLSLKANSLPEGSFASEEYLTYFKNPVSSSDDGFVQNGVLIYPIPVDDMLYITITERLKLPVQIKISDYSGIVRLTEKIASTHEQINVGTIPPGLYIISAIDTKGNNFIMKLSKQ